MKIILIIIFTGMMIEVEQFENFDDCLVRSKSVIGEEKKGMLDPGFHRHKFIAEIAFCVQGNIKQ